MGRVLQKKATYNDSSGCDRAQAVFSLSPLILPPPHVLSEQTPILDVAALRPCLRNSSFPKSASNTPNRMVRSSDRKIAMVASIPTIGARNPLLRNQLYSSFGGPESPNS